MLRDTVVHQAFHNVPANMLHSAGGAPAQGFGTFLDGDNMLQLWV
jgi:hypothetical protein